MNAPLTPAEVAAALFNPDALVDELGLVKAQIAELENRETTIKDALINGGRDKYAGTFYDVSVSRSERETIDSKRLRADLGEDIVKDYLKTSTVVTVRVVAKK